MLFAIYLSVHSFPLSQMVIVANRMTKHSRDFNLNSELRRIGGGGGGEGVGELA